MENITAQGASITKNEFIALKACLNYESREDQLSDNYSNGGQEEFESVLGWKSQAVSALIGSMEAKGLGYSDDNEGNGHIFWLSDLGVNVVFDLIEQGF